MLTLFRMSTGEAWNDIMFDCARERSIIFDCVSEQSFEEMERDGINGCGQKGPAIFYFLSFMLIVSFIFLNLFIAIILEGFSKSQQEEDIRIKEETLEEFTNVWMMFDPKATGFIEIDDLVKIVIELTELELKKAGKDVDAKNDFLFNFHHSRLLTLYCKWKKGIGMEDDKDLKTIQRNWRLQYQLKRHINVFVGKLHIPTYNKITHYNFHDVLTGFIKYVFESQHEKSYHQREKRIALFN